MKLKKTLFTMGLVGLLAACGSDSDNDNGGNNQGGNNQGGETTVSRFVFPLKTLGEGEPEYLIDSESISEGTLTAQGTGIEQLGWNFFYNVGNTVFASGYEEFETTSYRLDANGDVVELARFSFDAPLEMYGTVGETTLIATDLGRSGAHTPRTLYTVDASTGKVTAKTPFTIFDVDTGTPGAGQIGVATALKVRGDKLYVPYQIMDDGGNYSTPEPNNAYVAIYDYPLAENAAPTKIISSDKTANIGNNGFTTGLISTDNGDLYSYSNGRMTAGYYPPSTKPSGILRIPADATEFDEDYFFNITEKTDGGFIFWFDHIGGNKALARIIPNEDACSAAPLTDNGLSACIWVGYTKAIFNQKLVILDLEKQTITDVEGVPLHQKRYTSPLNIIDGKVYVSIETKDTNAVYAIDVETGVATKGADFEGKTIKGFFQLSHTQSN